MPTPPDTETDHASPQNAKQHGEESSIDVLDLLILLVSHWRRIAVVTLVALVLGAIVAFLLKPVYTAKALILPPQQAESASSELLGSLAALGGGGLAGGLLKSPAETYVGILQSNTIADSLIQRFSLQKVYKTKTLVATRRALESHAHFETGKDSLIHISVTSHSPQLASNLANGFITELYKMNSTLAITEAAQRRLFFSQQVAAERQALDKAEDALAATQVKTGIIQLSGQAQIILRTIAQVQAQITSDEVQLQGLLASSTEQNPDVQRLRQEIAALNAQLAKLQSSPGAIQPGNTQVPTGRLPQDALEYTQKLRDVEYHETLFNLLSRQYEAARIDEAKSAPLIQVVDHAAPPDQKSGPHRSLITLATGFVGFLLACLWALGIEGLKRMRVMPGYSEKFERLRASLHR